MDKARKRSGREVRTVSQLAHLYGPRTGFRSLSNSCRFVSNFSFLRISTNVKLEQKIAEDSKKLNDMRNGVKNLMDRFMEEKTKHKAELAKLKSQLDLLTS